MWDPGDKGPVQQHASAKETVWTLGLAWAVGAGFYPNPWEDPTSRSIKGGLSTIHNEFNGIGSQIRDLGDLLFWILPEVLADC